MAEATARKNKRPTKPNGEFRMVRKRVASLKPSPENSQIYRATPDDPDIAALAQSIKRNGCDPLTTTADSWIVSGHRRHAALLRIGQEFVTCKVLQHARSHWGDDEYLKLLRDHNHQRSKTVAEQVREELIDINPADSHARLREQREESLFAYKGNEISPIKLGSATRRCSISEDKTEHVRLITKIVHELLKDYWPLSSRGVHYPLLNFDFIRGYYWPRKNELGHGTRRELRYLNDEGSYDATCDLITRLRLNGTIPWEAFDDPTRPLKEFRAFTDAREFVRQEAKQLFGGYWRDLLQTQPNHIEVVCEKNTIYHMVLRVTQKYQIPTSSGRGFNSIDPWHDLAERYSDSGKERLILIVLSDFDPEGERIPIVAGQTLRDDFNIPDVQIIKAGVTREQITKYNLPPMNFAKESSPNFDWFKDRNNGDDKVYELEALQPEDMLADFEKIVRGVIDVELFNREIAREAGESAYLEACRKTAISAMKGIIE